MSHTPNTAVQCFLYKKRIFICTWICCKHGVFRSYAHHSSAHNFNLQYKANKWYVFHDLYKKILKKHIFLGFLQVCYILHGYLSQLATCYIRKNLLWGFALSTCFNSIRLQSFWHLCFKALLSREVGIYQDSWWSVNIKHILCDNY